MVVCFLFRVGPLKRLTSCVSVLVMECSRGDSPGENVAERRARWRLMAAARMRDSWEAVGILKLCGSHLTVSAMRVDLVDGVQTLWHL